MVQHLLFHFCIKLPEPKFPYICVYTYMDVNFEISMGKVLFLWFYLIELLNKHVLNSGNIILHVTIHYTLLLHMPDKVGKWDLHPLILDFWPQLKSVPLWGSGGKGLFWGTGPLILFWLTSVVFMRMKLMFHKLPASQIWTYNAQISALNLMNYARAWWGLEAAWGYCWRCWRLPGLAGELRHVTPPKSRAARGTMAAPAQALGTFLGAGDGTRLDWDMSLQVGFMFHMNRELPWALLCSI